MSHCSRGPVDRPPDEAADLDSDWEKTAQQLSRDRDVDEKYETEVPQQCRFSLYNWNNLIAALNRYLSVNGKGHTMTPAAWSFIRPHMELNVNMIFLKAEKMNGEPP